MNQRQMTASISAEQLTCILVLTRLGSLIPCRNMTLSTVLFELVLTCLFAGIAWLLDEKLPKKTVLKFACGALAVIVVALDIYRLYRFFAAESEMSLLPWIAPVLVLLAAAYAWFAGETALARTAPILLAVVLLFLLVAVICSVKEIRLEAIAYERIKPSVLPLFDVAIVYLLLSQHTVGNRKKALLSGLAAIGGISLLVCAACVFCVGAVKPAALPVHALFQLEGMGSALHLDICYLCAYMIALFYRAATLLGTGVRRH